MPQHHTDDPARELRRVVDRCVGYPLARWSAARPGGGPTAQEIVHATGQALADLAAEAQRRPPRSVPRLRPHALADQITVLTRDALGEAPEKHPQIAELLAHLRRAL